MTKQCAYFFLALIFSTTTWGAGLDVKIGQYGAGTAFVDALVDSVIVPMKIDTGAKRELLMLAPWNAAYPSWAPHWSYGLGGGPFKCDLIWITSLEVDGVSQTNPAVARCDQYISKNTLSMSYMKRKLVVLDFDKKEFLVRSNSTPQSFRIRKATIDGVPGVSLTIGGNAVQAIFDTGAALNVIDDLYVRQNPRLFQFIKHMDDVQGIGGNIIEADLYKIANLELNGVQFRNEYVLSTNLRSSLGGTFKMILGFNSISRFNWKLDFSGYTATAVLR